MEGVAARIDGNKVDAAIADRGREHRALDDERTGGAEGIAIVAAEFIGSPRRDDASAEGDLDAFFRIGRIAGKANGGGDVFRAVRVGVVGGKLRAGENHRLADATLQLHQQRGFFHRIGSVQDDDAIDGAILEFGFDGTADALHVGKGEARGILGHQVDGAKLCIGTRHQSHKVSTRQDRRACSIFPTLAGDGPASGDQRYGRRCKRHISESSYLSGTLASTARSAASRWMRSRIIYQPTMRAGPMIASEAIVQVPTG